MLFYLFYPLFFYGIYPKENFIFFYTNMLVIRLSRHGRKNLAVYRVVLSEHTKPVKYGYQEVL